MLVEPTTVLRRASNLTISIELHDSVTIQMGDVKQNFGHHALALLDIFAVPRSFEDAKPALQLRASSVQDWIALMNEFMSMVDMGILVTGDGKVEPILSSNDGSFASAAMHAIMLNYRTRTERYIQIIKQTVRPGDVVVEIGTGSGVLSVAAAQAGAARVYSIESTRIAEIAAQVFASNGVEDRVTLLRGVSTHISLPEKADVLISEIIGSDPLAENVLTYVNDAITRFMKPDARYIPAGVQVFAVLVELHENEIKTERVSEQDLSNWREWYGIDLLPLKQNLPPATRRSVIQQSVLAQRTRLCEPVLLADLPLDREHPLVFTTTRSAQITQSGILVHGVAVYFALDLGNDLMLTNVFIDPPFPTHWLNAVWVLGEPLKAEVGETLIIEYTVETTFRGVRVQRTASQNMTDIMP